MLRTYTTEVDVQASTIEEANVIMNRMKVDGTLYQLELEQSNAEEFILIGDNPEPVDVDCNE